MENKTFEIYTLIDPQTKCVRYVGCTSQGHPRFNQHIFRAKAGATPRDKWIHSLLEKGLKPEVEIVEKCAENWPERESFWIAHYRKTCELTNRTNGGLGTIGCLPTAECRELWSKNRRGKKYAPGRVSAMKGKTHTPEARAKIAAASTGSVKSPECRAKISEKHKGKKLSPEHCKKIGDLRRGKKHTDVHKAKIRAACTTRKPVECVQTGIVYESIAAAAIAFNVSASSICQAIKKSCKCKGFNWKNH